MRQPLMPDTRGMTQTFSKVFCGTIDGHYCSVGCQVAGKHRDHSLNNPWVTSFTTFIISKQDA